MVKIVHALFEDYNFSLALEEKVWFFAVTEEAARLNLSGRVVISFFDYYPTGFIEKAREAVCYV